MEIISNTTNNNHLAVIKKLIESSTKIIISSGWMKKDGLEKLIPSFEKTIKNNHALITIFSNIHPHTQKLASRKLEIYKKSIKHIIVPLNKKTLHTKMYYFEKDNIFTVVIGSANITSGGLLNSEELSILIEEKQNSKFHQEILEYIKSLEHLYGKCLTHP